MWFLGPNVQRLVDRKDVKAILRVLERGGRAARRAWSALESCGDREGLLQIQQQLADSLAAGLRDRDHIVRSNAMDWLARVGSDRCIDHLCEALRTSDDSDLRLDIAYALGEMETMRAEPALLDALGDKEPGVRRRAAGALGRIRAFHAVDALAALLRDPEAAVRRSAVYALSSTQNPQALEHLRQALTDPDEEVRRGAQSGIEYISLLGGLAGE